MSEIKIKNPVTEDLVIGLKASLTQKPGETPEDILKKQILTLDHIFRRLLSDGDHRIRESRWDNETSTREEWQGDYVHSPETYQNALRTQEQCRSTIKTLNHLKLNKPLDPQWAAELAKEVLE